MSQSKRIRIVADAAIPWAKDAFSLLGDVSLVPGRRIDRAAVAGADALVVRTVTQVGEALLAGSGVRFVGTATIGVDHVDEAYLRRSRVGFASAAGCNATSVAEYVITALLQVAGRLGWELAEKTLGVIGVGNCGSRVVARAEALGMTVLLNDPPLAREAAEVGRKRCLTPLPPAVGMKGPAPSGCQTPFPPDRVRPIEAGDGGDSPRPGEGVRHLFPKAEKGVRPRRLTPFPPDRVRPIEAGDGGDSPRPGEGRATSSSGRAQEKGSDTLSPKRETVSDPARPEDDDAHGEGVRHLFPKAEEGVRPRRLTPFPSDRFRPIEELYENADVLTYHVPLNTEGPDRTLHMIDAAAIGRMRPGAVVINACRGPVHETAALKDALRAGRLAAAVLDVWEDEPTIDLELLALAAFGTPHIAGYSRDGKVGATAMMFEAMRRHFGIDAAWDGEAVLPPPPVPRLTLAAAGRSDQAVLAEATAAVYGLAADDAALRRLAALPAGERGAHFDRLRSEYPVRREFRFTTVDCPDAGASLRAKLAGLGFRMMSSASHSAI